nr:hypothetical protein [Actinoplanes solisilvae]
MGHPAGDVDDRTAVGQQRRELLDQEQRSLEEDVHERVEVGFGDGAEQARTLRPGVVDEVVEVFAIPFVAQQGRERTDEPVERTDVVHVEAQGGGRAPAPSTSLTAASASPSSER